MTPIPPTFRAWPTQPCMFRAPPRASYIGIDEKGAEAAAYTKIDMSPTACPDEPEEFLTWCLTGPSLYGVTWKTASCCLWAYA